VSLLSYLSHLIYFDSVALNYIFLTSCEVILASACVVLGAQVCKWRVVVLCCVADQVAKVAPCTIPLDRLSACSTTRRWSQVSRVALILLGSLGRLFTPLCLAEAFIFFVFLIETCDSSWCCCSLFVASSAWRRRGALCH
jgi:hypothetical protein